MYNTCNSLVWWKDYKGYSVCWRSVFRQLHLWKGCKMWWWSKLAHKEVCYPNNCKSCESQNAKFVSDPLFTSFTFYLSKQHVICLILTLTSFLHKILPHSKEVRAFTVEIRCTRGSTGGHFMPALKSLSTLRVVGFRLLRQTREELLWRRWNQLLAG